MILKRNTLILGVFLLCAVVYLRNRTIPPLIYPNPATGISAHSRQGNLPARITISKIHVDTTVDSVGMNAEGAMESPATPQSTAWFNLGPIPGEEGSAVIAGHYGWKDRTPAVFDRLNEIQKGDIVTVEHNNGLVSTFIVREIRIYDAGVDATDIFVSTSGGSHLNLITCIGIWDVSKKSYAKRLVVFTDKLAQP